MTAILWTHLSVALLTASTTFARTPTMDQAIIAAAESVRDSSLLSDDNSVLVESDMRFTYQQWELIQTARRRSERTRTKRKAVRRLVYRWPDGIIPYTFSNGFREKDKNLIRQAMQAWEDVTCLSFRVAEEDEPSVTFVPTGGCSSHVGKTGRAGQPLTLGRNCLYKGVIMHEIGHAFGFIHEHSRPDRDKYVTIQYQNVKDGMNSQFDKFPTSIINTHNVLYDYESIMHYGKYYFTRNQMPTIKTKDPSAMNKIGNRYAPSFNDIHLANLMYSCADRCSERIACSNGFQGKDCRCWCKGTNRDSPLIYCDTRRPVGTNTTTGSATTQAPVVTTPAPKPTATPGGTNNRGDKHRMCRFWASRGECSNNPSYMHYYCNASCSNLPDKCEDIMPRVCRRYSRFCGVWPTVQSYCPKTCGRCTIQQRLNSCEDVSAQSCRLLALMNRCTSSNPTVKRNVRRACPYSCGLCEPARDGGTCEDKTPLACGVLKAQGRCEVTNIITRQTLRRVCAKTCNLCPEKRTAGVFQRQCVDRMNHDTCQEMVEQRKCVLTQYRYTMELYCRSSCDFCDV